LGEAVKGTPHVRDDGFDVPGPPLQFLPKSFNALAIAAEDLDDLAASKPGSLVPINPLENIASWCQTGELSSKSSQYFGMSKDYRLKHLAMDLQSFLGVQYVLVMRTTRKVEPRMWGNTGYTGGSWEGEALLFEVDGKKFLGGIRFSASSSPRVEANRTATAEYLQNDLRSNAAKLVRKAFEARFSGSEPPFGH
jgi:hypothetical protein